MPKGVFYELVSHKNIWESDIMNIGKVIGLPEEAVSDVIKITVVGRNSIYIENYGRLILYTDDTISTKNKEGMVTIEGNGLHIETIDKNYISVTGLFLCISYEN